MLQFAAAAMNQHMQEALVVQHAFDAVAAMCSSRSDDWNVVCLKPAKCAAEDTNKATAGSIGVLSIAAAAIKAHVHDAHVVTAVMHALAVICEHHGDGLGADCCGLRHQVCLQTRTRRRLAGRAASMWWRRR